MIINPKCIEAILRGCVRGIFFGKSCHLFPTFIKQFNKIINEILYISNYSVEDISGKSCR